MSRTQRHGRRSTPSFRSEATWSGLWPAVLATALTMAAGSGALADVSKRFDFDVDGQLPSSDPEIHYNASRGMLEADAFSVADGHLVQTACPAADNPSYNFPNRDLMGAGITPQSVVVFEVRLQITSIQNLPGCFFQAFDGEHRYGAWFSPDGVHLTAEGGMELFPVDDLSEFHVYRLESEPNSAELKLFIDGELEGTVIAMADVPERSGFNWSGGAITTDACSDARWDYLMFSSTLDSNPTESVTWGALKARR